MSMQHLCRRRCMACCAFMCAAAYHTSTQEVVPAGTCATHKLAWVYPCMKQLQLVMSHSSNDTVKACTRHEPKEIVFVTLCHDAPEGRSFRQDPLY